MTRDDEWAADFRARTQAFDAAIAIARAENARLIAQCQRMIRRLDDQIDRIDDAIGPVGVRQPLTPRGPRPRTDAIALKEPT